MGRVGGEIISYHCVCGVVQIVVDVFKFQDPIYLCNIEISIFQSNTIRLGQTLRYHFDNVSFEVSINVLDSKNFSAPSIPGSNI